MKIELSVHAVKLRNVAGAFKGTSDPFVIATKIATEPGTKAHVIGKSETIKNNLNPNWVKVFILDYELGATTKVAFSIFDEVRKGDNKSMGSAMFDISEVLGARGSTKGKKIRGGGMIYVHARKSEGAGVLRLRLKGQNLKNVEGFFSKSDPFFELSRKVDSAGGHTWDNIYRSEDVHKNLNPEWKEAALNLAILCGGDLDLPLHFAVYDHESSGKHTGMGELQTSVNGLVAASQRNEGLKLRKKGKDTGLIYVPKADVSGAATITDRMANVSVSTLEPKPASPPPTSTTSSAPYVPTAAGEATKSVPTARSPSSSAGGVNFVDYIAGGCELNVAVAIDFTGSNGDPRKPGTLHHLSSTERNDYEKAIASIVSILAKYDSDEMFPVYGFGAKYDGVVRHCFQCGGASEHHGVAGVLEAYKAVFRSGLIMSAPTVFTEVIRTAASHAKQEQQQAQQRGSLRYTILLIVTDGAVSDVQATARCLQEVSDAPLSIVIVGVGTADFSNMRFLDDFNGPGRGRDIAQFVEFNKHSHSSQALTSETLDEIPSQLVDYFQSRGIPPAPPIQRSDSTVSLGEEEEEEEIDLRLDIGEEEIVVAAGGDNFVDGFNAGR